MRAAAVTQSSPAEPAIRAPARQESFALPLTGAQEEALLKLDLSDLVLPKVNDLNVDGLKSAWWARLLGR